ncbi:hypothetical protein Moror_13752 [Moniliophthora roreri MCA 2997]|uniref:DUF1365-domain-containing protein n=2 Tax=Moniliophthora roreri TaxID=221103 RepID=V2WTZ4_MONRO|nr:hypothetical protein Moror_13752 [Moniliophthora roreri MCA 2997]KAI3608710.1 hypothetical protein WG66_003760 [Moniliophthora roreri]
MTTTSAVTAVLLVGLPIAILSWYSPQKHSEIRQTLSGSSKGYILTNNVNHARLLPVSSRHSFTYSTVSLLLSLNALESGELNLGWRGSIFAYGGIYGRILGLRSDSYLTQEVCELKEKKRRNGSIIGKLRGVLRDRGFLETDEELRDAWILTMPSYFGFEGINPLTVYFCYKNTPGKENELWLVVLEVHNTFHESHVYILQTGVNEDPLLTSQSQAFDHRWTFPRAFHVSPFNDRLGYYVVSVRAPSYASDSPKPTVSIHLHTPSPDSASEIGPLKLTATVRAALSLPFVPSSVIYTLLRYPFVLFLNLPRILYHAWILHYTKRLDVYVRPEPFGVPRNGRLANGGVRWQAPSMMEKWARQVVERYLTRRITEILDIRVVLISSDPNQPPSYFPAEKRVKELKVRFMTPRFYTILWMAPSAAHALALGRSEGFFDVDDEETYLRVFASKAQTPACFRQRLRCWPLPESLIASLSIPENHFLDSLTPCITGVAAIILHHTLGMLEKTVFMIARARTVEGDEPWKEWERAARVLNGEKVESVKVRGGVGSVVHT